MQWVSVRQQHINGGRASAPLEGSSSRKCSAVDQLPPSYEGNSANTRQLLEDWYAYKRALVRSYIEALVNLPKSKTENHERMRQLLDSFYYYLQGNKLDSKTRKLLAIEDRGTDLQIFKEITGNYRSSSGWAPEHDGRSHSTRFNPNFNVT